MKHSIEITGLIEQLCTNLDQVPTSKYHRLRSRVRRWQKKPPSDISALQSLQNEIESAIEFKQQRIAHRPKCVFENELPVNQHRQEIGQAIAQHQLIIVCGETGSGKTTQLPKICLEAGRGIEGVIGHTQPRRLAAKSVANRIAQELQCELGQQVGYKIRYQDKTRDETYIKLMTDGILLAELQQERFLNQYDTLIIDEAHERSLNIDFILGV